MNDAREAMRTARTIAVIGTIVVAAVMTFARWAQAQETSATPRANYMLVGSVPTRAVLNAHIDIAADSLTRGAILQDIARRAGIGIVYDRSLLELARRTSLHASGTVGELIVQVLDGTHLDALLSPTARHLVIVARSTRAAQLRGIVLDSVGAGVAAARVELAGTPFATSSAPDGSFTFGRVPAGSYDLRVRRVGYRPAERAVQLPDQSVDVDPTVIMLDPAPVPLSAMVVSPGYFGIMTQQVSAAQTLGHEQIRTRPQLGEDLFRSINRLPGLASDDFSAGFHVRGADVDAMYISLDGVQLIEPFHLKDLEGALSILDVQTVSGIDLTTGGFTSEFGNRLGSVLAIRSVEPGASTTSTTLAASVTNLRAQSQGTFAGGRGSWLVAARRGYLDLALKLANTSDSLSPVYSDLFAKATWSLNERNRVALHVIGAKDALLYNDAGGVIQSEYGSGYAWLTWDTQPTERLSGTTVVSLSGLSWLRSGTPTPDGKIDGDAVHDRRRFGDVAVRNDWTWTPIDRAVLRWGAEFHNQNASYDYRAVHVSSEVRNGTVSSDTHVTAVDTTPTGTQLGVYVTPRISLASWLTAEIGARYDRTSYTGDALFSPRANVVATLGPTTSVRAAMGRYDQPQPIYSLQIQDGVSSFGSADIANQRVLGVEQRVGDVGSIRVEAYDRDVIRERSRYVNLRTGTQIFPEFLRDRVLLNATSGRARGLEFMARQAAPDGIEWSASYALSRVTDRVGDADVPRTYDQRHSVYVDASYRPEGASWRISAAWQVHSGWPKAPITYVVDTLRNSNGSISQYVDIAYGPMSAVGDSRLPWYHRTDLRFTRDIATSRGRVSFFVDLFNVFNNPNPKDGGYSFGFNNGKLFVVPALDSQIPRFPSAGISWDF